MKQVQAYLQMYSWNYDGLVNSLRPNGCTVPQVILTLRYRDANRVVDKGKKKFCLIFAFITRESFLV